MNILRVTLLLAACLEFSVASPRFQQSQSLQKPFRLETSHFDAKASHILELKRQPASSSQLSYIRRRGYPEASNDTQGSAPLTLLHDPKLWPIIYLTEAQFGSQNLTVIVDTRLADTWVIGPHSDIESHSFGPAYEPSSTFEKIEHGIYERPFFGFYGDVNGSLGYENITLAGIALEHQLIALADHWDWEGDGAYSGVIGFGLGSELTVGKHCLAMNASCEEIEYMSLFPSIYLEYGAPPIFNLTINRPDQMTGQSGSGQLAIGMMTSDDNEDEQAGASFLDEEDGLLGNEGYAVHADAFIINGSERKNWHSHSREMSMKNLIVCMAPNSDVIYLPWTLAEDVNALFNPRAHYNKTTDEYQVECSTKVPEFGIKVAGQTLFVNGTDLVLPSDNGGCKSGISHWDESYNLRVDWAQLGDPFFRNVIATFDIGMQEMRFTQREPY